jgi:hypothetical protein
MAEIYVADLDTGPFTTQVYHALCHNPSIFRRHSLHDRPPLEGRSLLVLGVTMRHVTLLKHERINISQGRLCVTTVDSLLML